MLYSYIIMNFYEQMSVEIPRILLLVENALTSNTCIYTDQMYRGDNEKKGNNKSSWR